MTGDNFLDGPFYGVNECGSASVRSSMFVLIDGRRAIVVGGSNEGAVARLVDAAYR